MPKKKIDGSKIVNAKTKLTIKITPSDINNSSRKSPEDCAMAVAVKRICHAKDVRVHLSRTFVKQGKEWVRYRTPINVSKEIVAFDRGGTFEPGEYELIPLTKNQAERHKPRGPHKSKGAPRRIVRATGNVRRSGKEAWM